LKTACSKHLLLSCRVAPRVGAWIEKEKEDVYDKINNLVAPRVGAWIENKFLE